MREGQLMLSDDKTEFLIIGARQQLSKVSIQSIKIAQTEVSPVASARNLGTIMVRYASRYNNSHYKDL